MPYAAITYRVKPGFEDEIAKIFTDFQRLDKPTFDGADGKPAGRLLGTGVFIKDDVMVRFIHYEGDFAAISSHLAKQRGVHLTEERLAPYLQDQRDTKDADGFRRFFQDATMRSLSQLTIDTHPAKG